MEPNLVAWLLAQPPLYQMIFPPALIIWFTIIWVPTLRMAVRAFFGKVIKFKSFEMRDPPKRRSTDAKAK